MGFNLKKNHLHIYERRQTNKDIYRCTTPRCSHYIKFDLIIGKEAACCKCKKAFIIEMQQIIQRNKRLVCIGCSKSPRAKIYLATQSAVSEIFEDLENKKPPETELIPYSRDVNVIKENHES